MILTFYWKEEKLAVKTLYKWKVWTKTKGEAGLQINNRWSVLLQLHATLQIAAMPTIEDPDKVKRTEVIIQKTEQQ